MSQRIALTIGEPRNVDIFEFVRWTGGLAIAMGVSYAVIATEVVEIVLFVIFWCRDATRVGAG